MTPFTLSPCPGGPPQLILSGDIGVEHAAALHAALRECPDAPAPLAVDAAACGRLHGAILQVLLSATGGPAGLLTEGVPSAAWASSWDRYGIALPTCGTTHSQPL